MRKIILGFAILLMSVGMAQAHGGSSPFVPGFRSGPNFELYGTYGSPFRGGRTFKYKCRQVQGYGHVVRHRVRYKALIVATQCYDRWGRGYLVPGSSRVVRIIGYKHRKGGKHNHGGGHHKGGNHRH